MWFAEGQWLVEGFGIWVLQAWKNPAYRIKWKGEFFLLQSGLERTALKLREHKPLGSVESDAGVSPSKIDGVGFWNVEDTVVTGSLTPEGSSEFNNDSEEEKKGNISFVKRNEWNVLPSDALQKKLTEFCLLGRLDKVAWWEEVVLSWEGVRFKLYWPKKFDARAETVQRKLNIVEWNGLIFNIASGTAFTSNHTILKTRHSGRKARFRRA